jgi:hypothetical protein
MAASELIEDGEGKLRVKETQASVIYRDRRGSMMVNQTNLLFGTKKRGNEPMKIGNFLSGLNRS